MSFFDFPNSTIVNRVVPKNKFDTFTSPKQKKQFTESVSKITWANKLSSETINLTAKDIEEIQIFKIELKKKDEISSLLEVIDKAIPYHIIFWVQFEDSAYLSTSSKHAHPLNENTAVIDWTFKSEWFEQADCPVKPTLKKSIDAVYKHICVQISGKQELAKKSLKSIIENQAKIHELNKEIEKLKTQISRSKQFKEKVALNLELKEKERELEKINNQ
ncbi:DUF4391 family protein [Maribellus comscasis]|uniref:DUF4391 family protein n=1 Tax=Maribellus comscasis TaxID=2681766 RepID=A0A6I6JUT4_9BACT|nr:DUF4391 domain-containing protein [Maribellus comscasis]QGY44840.1 DUF4391 family protein [Maribellus comscasis]